MASPIELASRAIFNINPNEDPRVGSGRDGSEGEGTLSGANGNKGSSLEKLGSTFIPISIYVAVCLLLFLILRRRMGRVYSPRSIAALRAPEPPAPTLPNGWFNWILPFLRIPDTYVLNHASLDGFFFLRFLKLLRNIFSAGCLLTWPVLFPLHATGGNGLTELELLTMGNVVDARKLYAHALIAWLFFGFVLFTVVRESIYYINIRQAFLSAPYHSQRLSSRTVLLTSVPRRYLDEARIRKIYGDAVRRVWIPRSNKMLVDLVKEREQTAMRLEKAEIALIRKANVAREKMLRRQEKENKKKRGKGEDDDSKDELARMEEGISQQEQQQQLDEKSIRARASQDSRRPSDIPLPSEASDELAYDSTDHHDQEPADTAQDTDNDYTHPYGLHSTLPDVRGSVAALYIPTSSRPHHRPIGNYGRSVDTIRWTRRRLGELNRDIGKLRHKLRSSPDDSTALGSVFIEFDTQESAQAAHQVLTHHQPLHMAPRLLGIRPDEVVWSALRMKWWERIVRRFAMLGLIVAAIVFWSIPSALVGLVTNIESMSDNVSFLGWIGDLPGPIKGFLTGFVPALALSLFMALVPGMMRACAVFAGVPSLPKVELFTQTAYFAFQVVQVFLITTLTSAASGALFSILTDPISAADILAKNLPTSSNFYLSYILIQCLANAGTAILHPFDLLRQVILGRVAMMPRSHYRLWRNVRPTRWGRDFPVFANLGVIALSYAVIAPLVLVFAAAGMWLTHIVWRYNLIFVFDSDMDTKGLHYPRALNHLTVGLYFAMICLTGLFFLKTAIGPAVLMILLLVFTVLVHFTLHHAISPLLHNLPQTLSLEEEIQREEEMKEEMERNVPLADPREGEASTYYDTEAQFGDEDLRPTYDDEGRVHNESTPEETSRAVEGAGNVRTAVGDWLTNFTISAAREQASSMGIKRDKIKDGPPGVIARWMFPHIHEDFIAIRKNILTLPDTPRPSASEDDDERRTYFPPELWTPRPILWIPRDEARVSRQEVAHTREVTGISDKGARLDVNGRVVVDVEQAPFALPRVLL